MRTKCRFCGEPIFIIGSPEFEENEENICLNCRNPKSKFKAIRK